MNNNASGKDAPLKLVLITTGLRPVAHSFAQFPEQPVGVIVWDKSVSGESADSLSYFLRRLFAKLRARRYASLLHLCRSHGLLYREVSRDRPDQLQKLLEQWQCDLVITSGCSMIPMVALEGVRLGGINLHPSLLPSYRGANPFFWQVADAVDEIGVTVHRLASGADTGDILGQKSRPRPDGVNKDELTQLTEADLGVPLLKDCIVELRDNPNAGSVQSTDSPTGAAKAIGEAELVRRFPLSQLNARQAWNLICYWQSCPKAWLESAGCNTRHRWSAATFTPTPASERSSSPALTSGLSAAASAAANASEGSAEITNSWRATRRWRDVVLEHPTGRIQLKRHYRFLPRK